MGDMRKLSKYFKPGQFNAAWAQGSLLHIQPEEVDSVLEGIQLSTVNGSVIHIGLKDGDGTVLVDEDKLGKPMQREFTLWRKEDFIQRTEKFKWRLIDYMQVEGSPFRGATALWHKFTFVRKIA